METEKVKKERLSKPVKIWTDHTGVEIPEKYVPEFEKEKEKVVDRNFAAALKISKQLENFKMVMLNELDALFGKMMLNAGVDITQRKGNYTVTSFDKTIKFEVNMSERIEFDDNITLAQQKINTFLQAKMEGIDSALQEIINSAFSTSKGKLDTKRILGLFKLKIDEPLWMEAMELIKISIQRNSGKRYINVYQKDKEGAYTPVILSFSAL